MKHWIWALALCCASSWAIDINTATVAQLTQLKGIGEKTALSIVQERQAHGSFASFDALAQRVKGLGAKKIAQLRSQGLRLSGAQATSALSVSTVTPEVKPKADKIVYLNHAPTQPVGRLVRPPKKSSEKNHGAAKKPE